MRAQMAAAFTLSLVVNVGTLHSFDRMVAQQDTLFRLEQEKREVAGKADALRFEYIESPPRTSTRPIAETKKISDHDAVAQDLTPGKEYAARESPPQIEQEGPADQLQQQRFDPTKSAAPPAPLSQPAPQQQAVPPSPPSLEPVLDQPQMPSQASPASTPALAQPGLTGRDRITTQATSRSRSHGAQIYGSTSFEATGSGMGEYMKNLKERVWLAWFPYLSFHYPMDFKTADAVLEFKLDTQGQVRIVKILTSHGSPLFAAFCVEVVQRAAPYGPLPQEILDLIGKDELEVKFAFHYW